MKPKTDYTQRLRPLIRHLEQHYSDAPDSTAMAAKAALHPIVFTVSSKPLPATRRQNTSAA